MKYFELVPATACALTALLAVQQTDRTTTADGGAFVQVGTHRMYVRCVGNAGSRPTVILESGGGGHSGDGRPYKAPCPQVFAHARMTERVWGEAKKDPVHGR
jgi:hypothetical protein